MSIASTGAAAAITPGNCASGTGTNRLPGLTGSWGSLTLGRQYTMLFWSQLDADILGPNAYGSASLDSYLPNARADNAMAYRGTFNGFTVGATFSLGRDAVNVPSPSGTNCARESQSKRTAIYATAGRIGNSGTLALAVSNAAAGNGPVAGGVQVGIATGVRHAF